MRKLIFPLMLICAFWLGTYYNQEPVNLHKNTILIDTTLNSINDYDSIIIIKDSTKNEIKFK